MHLELQCLSQKNLSYLECFQEKRGASHKELRDGSCSCRSGNIERKRLLSSTVSEYNE